MPCYKPITAYRSRAGRSANGKWPITFNVKDGYTDQELKIPCGKCIGCRLERSRQWAMRCVDEAKLWPHNCFITLTYDNDHLPVNGSLNKRDFVLFIKRLRKKYGSGIRFFQCGEYGERGDRPHHHACIFNHDFTDKRLHTVRNGIFLYRSESLEKLWSDDKGQKIGYCTIGEVNFESAAYVARYCVKKINGAKADDHYKGRLPEYCTMSRMPGLGKLYYEKYKRDYYNQDINVIRGDIICKPARYYDKLYDKDSGPLHNKKLQDLQKGEHQILNLNSFDLIKHRRKTDGLINSKSQDELDRLEECKTIKSKLLKRSYESYET